MAFRQLETKLHRLQQSRFLRRPEGWLWVFRGFAYFKHHLSEFLQIAFLDVQHRENKFAWHLDTLKHRLIDFIKYDFKDVQEADYEFTSPFAYLKHHLSVRQNILFRYPGCRKLFCLAFRHLETTLHRNRLCRLLRCAEGAILSTQGHSPIKTSLKRFHESHFFRFRRCWKWIRMAGRYFETSLHRLRQSRFLRRPECRIWVLRAIDYLKHHLSDFMKGSFFDSRNAENKFAWPIDSMKHYFIDFLKVVI
jgi:hypothetical protein